MSLPFVGCGLGNWAKGIYRLQELHRKPVVPAPFRDQVARRLVSYLEEIDSFPRATRSEQRSFLIRFGMSFWRILARKTSANP